jgi:penicillin amidase
MARTTGGIRRWLVRGAVGGCLLALLLVVVVAWRWTRWPVTEGTRTVRGVSAPVEILRGPYGVPHIIAETPADAYFGLGFSQAQDRTLQLEVMRRAATGTLAEVLGDGEALDVDRLVRTLDIPGIAERQLANVPPDARALADAFVRGINEGLDSLGYRPPEMLALGMEPAHWRPVDCLALARLVSFGLAEDARTEALFARIADHAGPEVAMALAPIQPEVAGDGQVRAPLSGPGGRVRPFGAFPPLGAAMARGPEALARLVGLSPACSNWIVGPGKSASGAPIFAYDSHQNGPRIPSELYLAHLSAGGRLDAIGAVIVGLPGMYAGAAGPLAFGPTNLGGDAQDLLVLERDPERPDHYLAAAGARPFRVREERIRVRGREAPVALRVLETEVGPVVSDLLDAGGRVMALSWAGARDGLRVDGYIRLPLATSWPEARACLAAFQGAAQHYGVASADGTIAYQVTGPMPDRPAPPAPWPQPYPGDASAPLLSLDQLPHAVNPPSGCIVTANHRPAAPGAERYLGRTFVHTARHDRLVELLEAGDAMSADDVLEVGRDVTSRLAQRLVAPLVEALRDSGDEQARWLGARLAAWDGRMAADAQEPLLYHALLRELWRECLADELGPELCRVYAGRGEHSQERLARMVEDPDDLFWDDVRTPDVRESRALIVGRAASAAVAWLLGRLGDDRAAWRWGRLHTLTYRHYAHGVTPLLDLGPFEVPGDGDTPFRFGQLPMGEVPFRVETVTLVRLLVDLAEPGDIRAVISTGQSGWPQHPHWSDQAPLWLRGELIRIPRALDAVRAGCDTRLVLEPEPEA